MTLSIWRKAPRLCCRRKCTTRSRNTCGYESMVFFKTQIYAKYTNIWSGVCVWWNTLFVLCAYHPYVYIVCVCVYILIYILYMILYLYTFGVAHKLPKSACVQCFTRARTHAPVIICRRKHGGGRAKTAKRRWRRRCCYTLLVN